MDAHEQDVKFTVVVSTPRFSKPQSNVEKEDVFGHYTLHPFVSYDTGMQVAYGYGNFSENEKHDLPSVCPIWGDQLPYKSSTIVCFSDQEAIVKYWCDYCNGGGSVSRVLALPGNKVAIRTNYMAW